MAIPNAIKYFLYIEAILFGPFSLHHYLSFTDRKQLKHLTNNRVACCSRRLVVGVLTCGAIRSCPSQMDDHPLGRDAQRGERPASAAEVSWALPVDGCGFLGGRMGRDVYRAALARRQ